MEKFDWSKVEFARTRWRSQVIPDALPILIRWAQEGEAHSYSDLPRVARQLRARNQTPKRSLRHRRRWRGASPAMAKRAVEAAHFPAARHRGQQS